MRYALCTTGKDFSCSGGAAPEDTIILCTTGKEFCQQMAYMHYWQGFLPVVSRRRAGRRYYLHHWQGVLPADCLHALLARISACSPAALRRLSTLLERNSASWLPTLQAIQLKELCLACNLAEPRHKTIPHQLSTPLARSSACRFPLYL